MYINISPARLRRFVYRRDPNRMRFSSDPGLKVRHLRKPGQTSKPGRANRFRPGIAGVSTGVASFNGDLLIGII